MATVGNQHAAKHVTKGWNDRPWAKWRVKALDARCIKFLESQCIPTKGYGRGKPMKLAKFQKEWIGQVLGGDDYDSSVMTLPRGQGKSTFAGGI
ncbi:unnamed protein product, partial [Phaeothamnion confervicola]